MTLLNQAKLSGAQATNHISPDTCFANLVLCDDNKANSNERTNIESARLSAQATMEFVALPVGATLRHIQTRAW